MSASGILQAAKTISKTLPVAIGGDIGTENAEAIQMFFNYVKGEETGLLIKAYAHRTLNGTNHQYILWTESSGVYTAEDDVLKFTADGNYTREYDVRGIDYILFTQGGSDDDGSALGTLAVSYTLSSE
jgi:hypothetical protein